MRSPPGASGGRTPTGTRREQDLTHAAKIGSLATLAAGMAHEINNPNNFILLNSRMLAKVWQSVLPVLDEHARGDDGFTLAGVPYQEAREKVADLIRGVTEGALRIEKIVMSLRDFAQEDAGGHMQEVSLNRVVESALPIVEHLLQSATDRFSVRYGSGLPAVRGSHQQLEQVAINLIVNACQAMRDRSRGITVTTARGEDGSAVLEVADQGSGIPPGDREQVFKPFFTTKRASGGTGLGLPICQVIVANHGGTISVRSRQGRGTTVTVTFPGAREGQPA